MQREASAQLVTSFDPGSVPLPETTVDRALMQWSSLDRITQADALLIVADTDGARHVYDQQAIAALARG
ncbi:hypothetical protein ASE86_13650 [Sphingomonas sp. Leaf33]|nr:hypothetical protein ASE86_13650 [Sphingomonas sp. Leaf33]